jgi:hypothetical protein
MAQQNVKKPNRDAWLRTSPPSTLHLDTFAGQVPSCWGEPDLYSPGTPDTLDTPESHIYDVVVEECLEHDSANLLSDQIDQRRQWDLIEQSLYTLLEDDDDPLVTRMQTSKNLSSDYFYTSRLTGR